MSARLADPRAPRPVATWLGAALGLAFLLCVLSPIPSGALDVRFVQPSGQEALFGVVEVVVAATPEAEVARVELWVEGELVETLRAPPFRFLVDFGNENVEHRLEAVAYSSSGTASSGTSGAARTRMETPAIRIDDQIELDLTELYLTVTERASGVEESGESDGRRRVDDLKLAEITVLDEGERQEIVTFARGTVPLTAVLLVDGSDSMRGTRLAMAARGARAFLSELRELDQAKVMVFSDRLLLSTPFSGFEEVLTAGLDAVGAEGGSSINDHLLIALRSLDTRRGRRVVVLLSDGVDTTSILRMREIEPFVRRSPVLIYWIQLGTRVPVSSAWRDEAAHREEVERLERAVELSGGRVLPLLDLSEATVAFAGILEELREQYVIGFYPSEDRDDGSWHRIRVNIDRPGVKARTREGYIDQ